mgnify:CR=1 FL=1
MGLPQEYKLSIRTADQTRRAELALILKKPGVVLVRLEFQGGVEVHLPGLQRQAEALRVARRCVEAVAVGLAVVDDGCVEPVAQVLEVALQRRPRDFQFGLDFDDDGGTRSTWGNPPEGGDQVFWPVQERKK